MTLKLRSELLDYERVTLEEWRIASKAVRRSADEEVITRVGNQHRIELLDGGHRELPEEGYFKDDKEGMRFILEWVEDPTWETFIWAASMHCGGIFESEALEQVVSEAEGEYQGEDQ